MERLSEILGKFNDAEEMVESTSVVLETLAEMYEVKGEVLTHKNVVAFKMLIDSVGKTLAEGISELDIFIMESKKE